jgi:hypothetical protein
MILPLKQIKIDEIRIDSASSEKKDGDSEDCTEEKNSILLQVDWGNEKHD